MKIIYVCDFDETHLEDRLKQIMPVERIKNVQDLCQYLSDTNEKIILVSQKFVGVYNMTTEIFNNEEIMSNIIAFMVCDQEYPKGKSDGFPRYIPSGNLIEKFLGCFHDEDHDLMFNEINELIKM